MTAKRISLGFLDTHSLELADYVVASAPVRRLELVFECLGKFPRQILNEPQVVDAISMLNDNTAWTKQNVERVSVESGRLMASSIDADEIGEEEESNRLADISSILAAVAIAMNHHPLSAFDTDKCLYYLSDVLTEDFIRQLIEKKE